MDDAAPRLRWKWYAAWAAVGFGVVGGVLSLFSIGIFLIVAAALAAARLLAVAGARSSASGLMTGMALPLLLVAYLNRRGPGLHCTTTTTALSRTESCTQLWNPWPWLGFAVLLLVFGVGEFAWRRRLDAQRSAAAVVADQRSTT